MMKNQEPFHEGELEAQRLAGEAEEAARNAPMIGDRIMAGALGFVREQTMAVIGSRAAGGWLWSSIVFGLPGFLQPAADRRSLTIQVQPELRDARDPLWANLEIDRQVGILVIDLATRRRLRINGRLGGFADNIMHIDVEESFANCPKYIQRREIEVISGNATEEVSHGAELANQLDAGDVALLRQADTSFVTSAHPERGLDSSHRGGHPGFIEVINSRTLRIPDYAGNSMFNTIGNLLVDPRAGLVAPDFERHKVLQMTGEVEVVWAKAHDQVDDTGRSWIFHLHELRRSWIPVAVQNHFVEYSPYNPARR
jgi:predicted pyridoxine 5'-phosphate oxidase superfamily flavin-nucleotide-binding protein